MSARLVLIDGSGYIFRAFYALPPLTRGDGVQVGAVAGFCNMLLRLMRDMPADDLVVVFDAGRTSFRNELYADYKANRIEPPEELVPQFPLVRDASRAFGLPTIEIEGFEADDVIATYAKRAREAGVDVLVVSSDKDLMQLVADGVQMYDPMKARPIDRDEVLAKFGVGPERLGDLLALAGDSSDNVPGVPGIGPKTAAQLLAEYGDLEGLLARAGEIKQPKRRQNLVEHADVARLSRRLVTLDDAVAVPLGLDELARRPPERDALLAFLRANDLHRLEQRSEELFEVEAIPDPFAEGGAVAAEPEAAVVMDFAALDALLTKARALGVLAIDTETTALDVARAELVGISLAVEAGSAVYLPLTHVDDFGKPIEGQLPLDGVLERLRPVLVDPTVLKVGHNLKYDMGVLARYGVEISPYDDTMLLSYVLDGGQHGHGLDELARLHFEHITIAYGAVAGSGKKQVTFDQVPIERAAPYAAEDAALTLRLHGLLKGRLPRERMATVYEELERPLAPVLSRMERAGIKVDTRALRQLSAEFSARMAELEEAAHKEVGHAFNLGSPKQLGEVLFDEMGLLGGRKTKAGGYGTDVTVLEGLAAQGHALPRIVLDWRQLQKLARTYADALVEQADPEDGRVHTSFAMASTSTGRLSSTDPNLQNIPIRTEEGRKIRRAFVPADGCVLMSADYSQIELRILAHVADIAPLKEGFAAEIDVHAITAAQMFGLELDKVDPIQRRNAKTINYGIIYGIGAWGLANRLGIPQETAREFIAAYFERYPGIRDYIERAKAVAREQGYVRTLFGRRCYTPEIKASNPSRRGYAERAAINAPIQGSAADIIKRAMLRVEAALRASKLRTRMLLQVHDELVFEAPEGEVDAVADLARGIMQEAAVLSVPLVVDVGVGATWDAAH